MEQVKAMRLSIPKRNQGQQHKDSSSSFFQSGPPAKGGGGGRTTTRGTPRPELPTGSTGDTKGETRPEAREAGTPRTITPAVLTTVYNNVYKGTLVKQLEGMGIPLDVSIPCRGLGARPTLSFMASGSRETALECISVEVEKSYCKFPAPGPQSERVPPVTAKASHGVAKGTARRARITWTPSHEASLLRISEAYKGEDLLLKWKEEYPELETTLGAHRKCWNEITVGPLWGCGLASGHPG